MSGPALIHLDEAVRCFRLGMDGAAHTAFVEFLDAFQGELAQAEEEVVAYFAPRIAEMLSALELDDTVWVADMLQADFRPALV